MASLHIARTCKACGGHDLSWATHNRVTSGAPDGRLRSNEVQCQFVLGCDGCSETLVVVGADQVAEYLTSLSKVHRNE